MSNVYDAQGNLVNAPGPGTQRYKDQNATVVDWFDTHPRPVEKVEPTVGTIVLTDSADREAAAKSLAALSTVAARNREGFIAEGATLAPTE